VIQVITTLDTETRDLREIRGSQLTTDNAKLVQGRHTHIQTGNSNHNRQAGPDSSVKFMLGRISSLKQMQVTCMWMRSTSVDTTQ
jgi:hypothetical protein